MATDIMPMASTPLYCTHTVRSGKKPGCAGHSVSASSQRAVRPPINSHRLQVILFMFLVPESRSGALRTGPISVSARAPKAF